ncbi:unnamed protein product [Nippostrongylus brasiliensis]|uniref:Cystatin domain-containing protein n=1 Tax=Nippostrongylus brasiliensis TaxID=27835 RepID=A0A0N4Y6J1_NIPBR|nr:unnamed protein product [Nippostrongylus brasiliensis]
MDGLLTQFVLIIIGTAEQSAMGGWQMASGKVEEQMDNVVNSVRLEAILDSQTNQTVSEVRLRTRKNHDDDHNNVVLDNHSTSIYAKILDIPRTCEAK